ncbi:MAG: acyl-CoA dehydrogenase, partial [Acidimicrobiia bacterium]
SFDRVRVPSGALLDRFASVSEDGTYHSPIASPVRRFFTTLGTLVGGRVSVASAAVAAAESAQTIAVRYAWRRRQFSTDGGPENRLIDYRTHQRRLLTRLAATYAYHFAAADLVEEYVQLESEPGDSGVDRRAFEGRAAGLKAFATWHSLETIQECRQACGGQGYMAVNRLGPMRDDVDVFTTFEGDNTVLAQLLAKSLLTDYRASFENLTPGRLVRYVAERVQGAVTETVPVIGSVGGELTDPDTCLALLERRSRLLVDKLALRVQARIDAGVDPGQAFLDVQPHAVSAARAASELDVYSSVRRLVIDDPALAGLIEELGTLFALWRVEADLPWFMETGLVTLNGAKQVRAGVTSLCEQIAPWSLHLVDAFGIPDEVLAAPIAL